MQINSFVPTFKTQKYFWIQKTKYFLILVNTLSFNKSMHSVFEAERLLFLSTGSGVCVCVFVCNRTQNIKKHSPEV